MVILTDILEKNSSNDNHDEKYDVFLSFRGLDTRLNFTNHLHQALERANLKTFLDKDVIPTGRYLKPELENAIKSSTASVIVLSKNYASSTCCLDELDLILDRHKKFKQIVIPIFYHVEPTDVRKQQNSFGDAMAAHRKKMEAETDEDKKRVLAEKIEIWKEALTNVSNITGSSVKGRLETEVIKEIVENLSKRIRVPVRTSLPLLIGKEDAIEYVSSWLKDGSSNTVDILSIYGMGGIGKSTLAKYIYDSYCREFDRSSIVEDISRKCVGNINGLLDLKNQLCNDISKASSIQVHDVSNKVLIVLDDIDSIEQLDALLGNKGFNQGSKIIITTRDMSLTERCELCKMKAEFRHTKYPLEHLSNDASLKLLCYHAFNCEELKDGYNEVSEEILKYCEGHPLTLKVLGCNLYNRDLSYWEGCVKELKKGLEGPVSRVNKILKMSFESLESENDKELFKYIACFFVGTQRVFAETILKACNINTIIGIEHLTDRCLLRTESSGNFQMHSLIQEMGKYVVDLESAAAERSLFWRTEDSIEVLKKKTGTRNIKALFLNSHGSLLELEIDAFSNMDNLKILILKDVLLKGSYENFPKELVYLGMNGSPLESMPSELQLKKLVYLALCYTNIKSFGVSSNSMLQPGKRQKVNESYSKENRLLGSLKILNLSYCYQLHTLGGFCEFPALETLLLEKCTSLVEVCETIEQCHQLVRINLTDCNKCRKLLTNIDIFKNVKTLVLDGCNMSELPFESSKKVNNNLIDLKLQRPSSSATVEAIIPRDFGFSGSYFSSSLVFLSLSCNNLSCVDFPIDWSCLTLLKELWLNGNPIVSMPSCVRTLPILESLHMHKCDMLTSIEHPPPTLRLLVYNHSNRKINLLRKMSFHPEMCPLKLDMNLYRLATSSIEIEGVVKIQPMAGVKEAVLRNLGWNNLEFTKTRHIETFNIYAEEPEECQTQMYYEFGIFSTVYGGEQMPNWISHVTKGGSISFIIPSSPKQLRGLNFCCVQMQRSCDTEASNQIRDNNRQRMPIILFFNITKNTEFRYIYCIDAVNVGGGECVTYISHWMFTVKEMEPGDHVTISMLKEAGDEQFTRKCGVSFVYDDDDIKEGEEDVLGYYKSWNHIIGGDLSPFQTSTREYHLCHLVFGRSLRKRYLIKEHTAFFRAFSENKSNKPVRAIEDVIK